MPTRLGGGGHPAEGRHRMAVSRVAEGEVGKISAGERERLHHTPLPSRVRQLERSTVQPESSCRSSVTASGATFRRQNA
jgi:hypothetical protein